MKKSGSVIILYFLIFYGFPLAAQHSTIDSSLKKNPIFFTDSLLHEPRYHLLQLSPGIRKADLAKHNLKVVRYLQNDRVIVEGDRTAIRKNHSLFEHATPAAYLWKLPDIFWNLNQTDNHDFIVKTSSPNFNDRVFSSVPGIKIISRRGGLITLRTTPQLLIKYVIDSDEVMYAGIESTEAREESRVLDLNLNPNTVNRIHHSFPDLNGKDMTISIKELQYDPQDIDLKERHVPSTLSSSEQSNHATDMATISAGAGNSFITGKGVAWSANITSSDFENLLPDRNEDYIALNAWVQNHSYGTTIENFYGSFAEAFDHNTNTLPELLHTFSSGNQGTGTSTQGNYSGIQGFANITGNAKMSKNSITVGSVDTTGNPVIFSSRGPAYDGRIKPELVAYSTQGSSNSAALVSGVAILLQQAYREIEGTIPASALIKSLLINSAVDAGAPGIDFITGYGSVDAYQALLNLQSKKYFSGSVTHGATKTFDLTIPPQALNLKISLVWNDPAASPLSVTALVNDLDMELSYNGSTWLPWTLNTNASVNELTMPATRKADHINNVEQISLSAPQAGTYTITIKGFDIPSGPQQFYIAYQWDSVNQFEWKFPTGSDNIPYNGETGTYFYWHSTLNTTTGRLEYSVDGETSWKVIADNIDLRKGYYRWNDPPAITAVARARMVVDNSIFSTDRFTISQPLNVSVGFNCSDSVMIQWPPRNGAIGYEVFTLQGKFMEAFTTTSDTAVILSKNQFPTQFFSVQPILREGFRAIRSPAFDYDALGTGCFLLSFYDETIPEDGIYLHTLLGTTYGVSELLFEHEVNGFFEVVGTVKPGTGTHISFLHKTPHQGLNRYRVRLILVNGEEVTSSIIENFFLTMTPFAVFPNPVSGTAELSIFSKRFKTQEAIFSLFKTDGTLVRNTRLISDREFVPLSGLQAGLYLYSIISEEGYFNGKLIIK